MNGPYRAVGKVAVCPFPGPWPGLTESALQADPTRAGVGCARPIMIWIYLRRSANIQPTRHATDGRATTKTCAEHSMTRKRILLTTIAVSCLFPIICGVFDMSHQPSERAVHEQFIRIRRGMTRAEVENIMWAPPTLTHDGDPPCIRDTMFAPGSTCGAEWDDGRHFVRVGFDDSGHVTEQHYGTRLNQFESFLRWLRTLVVRPAVLRLRET
jgi:hypothetical protein